MKQTSEPPIFDSSYWVNWLTRKEIIKWRPATTLKTGRIRKARRVGILKGL